jgi:hypothetical protein
MSRGMLEKVYKINLINMKTNGLSLREKWCAVNIVKSDFTMEYAIYRGWTK